MPLAQTEIPILASASPTRARMFEAAGIEIATRAAGIDEADITASARAEGASAAQCADMLAELKAVRISAAAPGRLVIGADQMLVLPEPGIDPESPGPEGDEAWLDKPRDRAEAARQLERLSGRTHHLIAAAVAVRDRTRLWGRQSVASLTMRPLSAAFIAAYLDHVGGIALAGPGAYRVEGPGAQLFARIEGDLFTVLGLPLLDLLDFLRDHGVLSR